MLISLSSRRTSPWFLIERKTIERFTSMRLQVLAAVPRSAAGYRRTEFSEWRPRPSGMRRSGHAGASHMFSALPPIAAGSEPCQQLRSAPISGHRNCGTAAYIHAPRLRPLFVLTPQHSIA
jgi:hypothetical protein